MGDNSAKQAIRGLAKRLGVSEREANDRVIYQGKKAIEAQKRLGAKAYAAGLDPAFGDESNRDLHVHERAHEVNSAPRDLTEDQLTFLRGLEIMANLKPAQLPENAPKAAVAHALRAAVINMKF